MGKNMQRFAFPAFMVTFLSANVQPTFIPTASSYHVTKKNPEQEKDLKNK